MSCRECFYITGHGDECSELGAEWRERAEKAEAEVARLRSAGQRLIDALDECEFVALPEEMLLANGMMNDALRSTSARRDDDG